MRPRPSHGGVRVSVVTSGLFAFALVALASPDLRACKCEEPQRPGYFPYRGETGVPRDAHVWVVEHSPYGGVGRVPDERFAAGAGARVLPGEPLRDPAKCRLLVAGSAVESEQTRHAGLDIGFVEYAPKVPFPANTKVSLVCGEHPPVSELSFETGTALESSSEPRGLGELEASLDTARIGKSDCESPGVIAEIPLPKDAAPRLFAVWRSLGAGPVDYKTAPENIITHGGEGPLTLGRRADCSSGQRFSFGYPGALVRLGIRSVDLAGRLSAPSELALEVPVWRRYQDGELANVPATELETLEARIVEQRRRFENELEPAPFEKRARATKTIAWSASVVGPLALLAGVMLFARTRRSVSRGRALPSVVLLLGIVGLIMAAAGHLYRGRLDREAADARNSRAPSLAEERAIFDGALAGVRAERSRR